MANREYDDPRLLSNDHLVTALHSLCKESVEVTATLLEYLAEVDERKLYLEYPCSSLFSFCLGELHLSESEAKTRILVARAARRFPRMLEYLRQRQIHLSGLRLLAPHLTPQGHEPLLAAACRKSKSEIEEIVARHAPRPAVPDSIREEKDGSEQEPQGALDLSAPAPSSAPTARRPVVGSEPLSGELFRFEFTAGRLFRDKLREAQDLLSHRLPRGEMAVVFDEALTLLVADLKKKRFAVGRKERKAAGESTGAAKTTSRHIPDAIKRAVWERDGERCAFVDERGQRCSETAFLQLDHVDGYARNHVHSVETIRVACAAHNQHAADKMYGKDFMQCMRAAAAERRGAQAPVATSSPTPEPIVTVERERGEQIEVDPVLVERADASAQGDPVKSPAGSKTPDAEEVARYQAAYGGLRRLGFRGPESKRALAAVRSQLGGGASLEQIVRLALRVLSDEPKAPSRRPSSEHMHCAP